MMNTPEETKLDIVAAAEKGDLATLRYLLSQGVNPSTKGLNGRTPLHVASYQGHTTAVNLLLQHHADPNAPDGTGSTPLHDAAQCGWTQVAVALLNAGACATQKNLVGSTPVEIAYQKDREEMLKVFEDSGQVPERLLHTKTRKKEEEESTEWWERQEPKADEQPPEAYNRRHTGSIRRGSRAGSSGSEANDGLHSPGGSSQTSESPPRPLSSATTVSGPGSPRRSRLSMSTVSDGSVASPPSSPGRSRFSADAQEQAQATALLQVTPLDERMRSNSMPSLLKRSHHSPLSGRRADGRGGSSPGLLRAPVPNQTPLTAGRSAEDLSLRVPGQGSFQTMSQGRSADDLRYQHLQPPTQLQQQHSPFDPMGRSAEELRQVTTPFYSGGSGNGFGPTAAATGSPRRPSVSPTWLVAQGQVTPPVTRSPMPVRKSLTEQIERLTALHLSGRLSDKEYAAERKRLAEQQVQAGGSRGASSPVYG